MATLQALACEVISTGRWQVRQAGRCDFFKPLPREALEAINLGTHARAGNFAASEDLHAMIRHLPHGSRGLVLHHCHLAAALRT